MKTQKTIYWTTTILLSAMMLLSAFAHFMAPEVQVTFSRLGFPDYFRIQLGIFKIAGVIVLLIPAFSSLVKNWAYAGFGITFLSAILANLCMHEAFASVVSGAFAMLLLIVSGIYYQKIQRNK